MQQLAGALSKVAHWYEVTIADWPWIRSAVITAPVAGAAFYLQQQLPAELKINLADANLYVVFIAAVFSLYLLLVAVLYNAKLLTERKLRAAEDGFRYDNRGTLFHGTQPAIAFRIVTFRGMLEGIAAGLDPTATRHALFRTGTTASADFAEQLPTLYNENVHRLKGGRPWEELSFSEKLFKWTDYDSATGWGIIAARVEDNRVTITVTHFYDLFGQPSYFSWFLAGYCNTVIDRILRREVPPHRGYTMVRCLSIDDARGDSVKFVFEMS